MHTQLRSHAALVTPNARSGAKPQNRRGQHLTPAEENSRRSVAVRARRAVEVWRPRVVRAGPLQGPTPAQKRRGPGPAYRKGQTWQRPRAQRKRAGRRGTHAPSACSQRRESCEERKAKSQAVAIANAARKCNDARNSDRKRRTQAQPSTPSKLRLRAAEARITRFASISPEKPPRGAASRSASTSGRTSHYHSRSRRHQVTASPDPE